MMSYGGSATQSTKGRAPPTFIISILILQSHLLSILTAAQAQNRLHLIMPLPESMLWMNMSIFFEIYSVAVSRAAAD